MVLTAGRVVRCDMGVHKPGLTSVRADITLTQTDLARPDGLDLAALQRDPCFNVVGQRVIVPGLSIRCDDLDPLFLHGLPRMASLSQPAAAMSAASWPSAAVAAAISGCRPVPSSVMRFGGG